MRNISSEHKIYIGLGALLSMCSIVPIWIVDYFPSVNGPGFLYITHMFKEMNNPALGYSDYFFRHLHYMPYLSVYFMIFCFSQIFPLLIAQKIVLSLIVILFPLSVFYFLKSIDPKKTVFGFSTYLIIYNFLFMRSYNNFVLATALFFIFLGYWERVRGNLDWKRLSVLNSVLLLVFLSHIIVVLSLLCVVFVLLLLENKRFKDILIHMLTFAVPTAISIVYFIWFTFTNSIWQKSSIELEHWFFKFENLFIRFLWPYSLSGKLLAVIPFVVVFCFLVYTKGSVLISFIRNGKITVHNTADNRNLLILLVIVLVYFCAPWKFLGWHKADVRAIPFIYIFLLASGQPFGGDKKRLSFAIFTSVLALILFVDVGKQVVTLDNDIKNEYLSGLQHVKRNKTMLPLSVGKKEFDVVNPYAHLYDYYGIFRGTITGKSLAGFNTISPVWYKDYKEFPGFSEFPDFNGSGIEKGNIDEIRDAYDYILIWGNNKRIEMMFLNNGFRLVFEKQRLHIFEPEQG